MAGLYYLLDTFSNEKFKGNPTPVCILEKQISVQEMYLLAREFNAPVTAYIEPKKENEIYPIRYFTVTGEIPACGHATLGAAFILQSSTKSLQIKFETIENIVLQTRKADSIVFIEYPKFTMSIFEISKRLLEALGITNYETHFFCNELQSLFIELRDENEVKSISPDFELLLKSSDCIKEVVVMSKSVNQNYDFVLRSFCPWIGINEDPVTGSVHSVLGHYWKDKTKKNKLTAFQSSERGGIIIINPLNNSVEIGGYNKIIIEGKLK